jgi:hypothetical protein
MQFDSMVLRNNYRWWEEAELRDLCEGVGLQSFTCDRQWRFIMFAATKPAIHQVSEEDGLQSLDA